MQGVGVKSTDAFTQWHPEGKNMCARSEGEPVMSKAIEIWASEVALGAVHTETIKAQYSNKGSYYCQGKILS